MTITGPLIIPDEPCVLDFPRDISEEKNHGIAAGFRQLPCRVERVVLRFDDARFPLRSRDGDAGGRGCLEEAFHALLGEFAWEAIAGCGDEAELNVG